MTIVWVLAEIVAGVLLAGGVTAATVVAAEQWGLSLGVWVPWATLAVCVVTAVGIGERLREATRR